MLSRRPYACGLTAPCSIRESLWSTKTSSSRAILSIDGPPRVLDIPDLAGLCFLHFRVGSEKFDHSRAVIRVRRDTEQLEFIL